MIALELGSSVGKRILALRWERLYPPPKFQGSLKFP
jgi:hypothetical protein